jgi:hypothetical protein
MTYFLFRNTSSNQKIISVAHNLPKIAKRDIITIELSYPNHSDSPNLLFKFMRSFLFLVALFSLHWIRQNSKSFEILKRELGLSNLYSDFIFLNSSVISNQTLIWISYSHYHLNVLSFTQSWPPILSSTHCDQIITSLAVLSASRHPQRGEWFPTSYCTVLSILQKKLLLSTQRWPQSSSLPQT